MVVLCPDATEQTVTSAELFRRSVGGAEANVAGTLAALGVTTTWVSRVGADPFGDVVTRDITSRGVRVLADRDSARPTGLYLKDPRAPAGRRMHYYRAGSAAAAMNAELLDQPTVAATLAEADVVHTSGITAGILESGSRLLPRLLELREEHGFVLSVDLNWRPALWQSRDTSALLALVRAADVLLLGADEGAAALGVAAPDRLRTVVGARPRMVIKADSHAASEHDPDGSTTVVPALTVEVVEPVGAGDGFAAGYLAALVDGEDATARLRQGHLVAAQALTSRDDHAPPPAPETRSRLLDCSAETWLRTRVTAAGITSPGLVGDTGPRQPE